MSDETPQTIGDLVKQAVADALAEQERTGIPASDEARQAGPQVPKVDHAPTNADEATELGKMFAEYRAEVAALRQELAAHRPRVVTVGAAQESVQDRLDARLAAIAKNSHYCPACGTLSKYPRICVGPDTLHPSHKPLEMVTTDELGGDPAKHTRAPSTDPDKPDLVAA